MIMTKKNHQPSPIIVAFDCADMTSATLLAEQLSPTLCRAKVGKELFTACGMRLDLKPVPPREPSHVRLGVCEPS